MGGRVQSLIVFGVLLLGWAAVCYWAGVGFALVAALLLVAVLVPVTLLAGHRFVNRWYVGAELVALVVTVVVWVLTGFVVAGIVLGALLGADVLVCSMLVLTRGRGRFRNVTRNLLVILAILGVATGASAITAALAPVASCGTASVGLGGATSDGSAAAGECFVASAETCIPMTLTVQETGVDELATHRYRIVADGNSHCHFTDSVTYGPPADAGQHATSYSCPALTAQIGAPGQQQVELTQCPGTIAVGVAAPTIPMNAFQPLPSPTPAG